MWTLCNGRKNNLKGPPAAHFNRHKDIGKCCVAVHAINSRCFYRIMKYVILVFLLARCQSKV